MINRNHTKRIMIIAVLLALIALTGIASAAINTFNIQVQDSSYNPISGATIVLTVPGYSPATRTTGADGKPTSPFSGYNVASPSYPALTISKSGYSTYYSPSDPFMEKTSTPGYTYLYTYPISTPTTTAITVTAEDSVNHAIIPGATVSITGASPTSQITDNTGKTGTFIVPISGFTIQISKSGYQGYTATDSVWYMSTPQPLYYHIVANVAPTPTTEPAHATVTYHISDAATNTGIGAATIVIRDNNNAVVGGGTTTNAGSEPGSFSHYFTPIPASYSIVVSKSGYSDYTHTYSSSPVDDSTVSISLTAITPTPTPTPDPGSYTSEYPPAYSDTYVKATTQLTDQDAFKTVDPSKSLTGTWGNSQWLSAVGTTTNQRFHIDLGSAKTISRIYYENAMNSGANTGNGVKDFTIWGSNNAGSFSELTYSTDTGWTQITPSQSSFDQHASSNNVDPKYISLTNSNSYRYYAFKFPNAYNLDGTNYYGVRRIELQSTVSPTPTPTPTPVPTPSITSVRVNVQDSVNHANIPGAIVSIPSASPTYQTTDNTGTTGTFQVSTSASGYAVNISASGYYSQGWTEYVWYSGNTQTLVYYITAIVAPTPTPEPAHAAVSYHIYDEGTSNGIAGATITIKDNTNAVIGGGTTTSTGTDPGRFSQYFTTIPPSYSITVSKSGYSDYVFTYSSSPVDDSIQTIYLSPSILILNLDVKSATTGYLIQGASVGIYDPDYDVWRNGTASTGMVYFDSTGANFEYPLTLGKNLTIAAWSDGYQYHSQNLTIFQPNYLLTLNLAPDSTLPTGDEYTIVFTVLSNYDKQPINEITVTSGLGAIKLTNTGGAATFQNVPAGVTTMFDFSGSGYLSASVSSTGSAGQVIMRQIELVKVGATPTPTITSSSSVNTSANTDLNIKGQTFLTNWADTAISMGELIFFLLFIFFAKKILS